MRISRVIPQIDYGKLSSDYQVFRLRSSNGKLGYADEVFDKLAQEAVIASVVFLGGGEAWVMTRRGRAVTGRIRSTLAGRDDLSFREEKSLVRVDDRVLLQLCLCAITGDAGMSGASNVCGRLIVVSLGKDHVGYFRGTVDPCVIHALEVAVSPRMELELKGSTFTSCSARRFKKSLPRFELVDGRYLRRALSYGDADARSLFCRGARNKNDRYGKFALMDASNPDKFAQSKLGILRSVLACLDELFDGAVQIRFEEAEDLSRIDCVDFKPKKRIACVTECIGSREVCVCDATGELGEQAKAVAEAIDENYGLSAKVTDRPAHDAANIRLVFAKDAYADGDDPYGVTDGAFVVQHMTPESGSKGTALDVAMKELALKLDVAEGMMTLIPWDWGAWDFALRVDSDEGDSFAFLHVGDDGSMRFEGPVSVIGASAEQSDIVDAFLLNDGCEFVVRGPEGDINVITRTELFGVPNFELVWHDLIERRADKRQYKAAIGRGKKDRGLYFADAVDIASCATPDGRRYYRVGLRGYGMHYRDTHRASVLREVIPLDGSRSLVDDMLPMLDTSFVRWGQPTVLPFPIKYLREWINARGTASSISRGCKRE